MKGNGGVDIMGLTVLIGKSFSSEIADVITALEFYLLREWKSSKKID